MCIGGFVCTFCSASVLTGLVVCILAWFRVARKLEDTDGLGVVSWAYLSSHTLMHSLNHCPKWRYCSAFGSLPSRNWIHPLTILIFPCLAYSSLIWHQSIWRLDS